MFLTESWLLDMIMISIWIWWTYYGIRAIDLRFAILRWKRERQLEYQAMYEVKKGDNVVN